MKPNAKDNVDEDGNPGKRHNLTISTFLMYFRLEMLAMILIQKCKTCFGCPRMVLWSLKKTFFSKIEFGSG